MVEKEHKGLVELSDYFETNDMMKEYIFEIIKEELGSKTFKKFDLGDKSSLEDIRKAISLYLEAKIKEYSAYSLLLKSGSSVALKFLLYRLQSKRD
ncbi:MAG: hypothetical protein ACQEQM_00750 [Thermoplasmatota archaeon]